MRSLFSTLFAAFLVLAVTFGAVPVKADSTDVDQSVLYVVKMQHGSDNFATYSGYIAMGSGQAYYWGGSRCPFSTYDGPSSTDLEMLAGAAVVNKLVTIYYKTVGSYRCYTGMVIEYN